MKRYIRVDFRGIFSSALERNGFFNCFDTDDAICYMAHSSPSSAPEMNGSSIALIERSPQRMLVTGANVRMTNVATDGERTLTIDQRPKHPAPSPPSPACPLARSGPAVLVSFLSRSLCSRPIPSCRDNRCGIHADSSERRRTVY